MFRQYCFPDFFCLCDPCLRKIVRTSAGENFFRLLLMNILRVYCTRRGRAAPPGEYRGACQSRVTPEDGWIS